MAIHFTEVELAERRRQTLASLAARGLDGLLIFRQESMFYLTGYDTFGFCFFQCLYLGADGAMTLLTRSADQRQAAHTSVIEDVRVWVDREGHDPGEDLREILEEHGCRGRRLGVELEAYGLTGASWRRLEAALEGFCTLDDASELVSRLRVVKSPAEIAYVRRAAALADDALEAAVESAGAGAFEGDILAAMQGAVFRGGGDYPGNEFIIGSGRDALLCRYFTGRRHLDEEDQLTLEHAGVYRRYHACLMRTPQIGAATREGRAMHAACDEAMSASLEALRPGEPVGAVFDAHARVLDAAGYGEHRLNACGYSLGATYTPTWMDWPMFYAGNSVLAEPGMVFFVHMILMDSAAGRAMTLGQSVLVDAEGCERLSRLDTSLIVC